MRSENQLDRYFYEFLVPVDLLGGKQSGIGQSISKVKDSRTKFAIDLYSVDLEFGNILVERVVKLIVVLYRCHIIA